jgi:hypothetical protein
MKSALQLLCSVNDDIQHGIGKLERLLADKKRKCMTTLATREQILTYLDKLPPEKQQAVLDFARQLTFPQGEPGDAILQHARELDFPLEDLAEIQRAIEEDCENVDAVGFKLADRL